MLRNELYKPWFVNQDWGFEIISGDYTGSVVQIRTIEMPDGEDQNMSVDYNVINRPESLNEESYKSEEFQLLFETIMNDIISEALDNYKDEQDRNNDPKESDSQ